MGWQPALRRKGLAGVAPAFRLMCAASRGAALRQVMRPDRLGLGSFTHAAGARPSPWGKGRSLAPGDYPDAGM